MNKNKAIILHSVENAKHCVGSKLHSDALLFSTHSSVDTYFKEYHNIECQCLSKFFTTEDIIYFKNQSAKIVDSILRDLDSKISPSINKQFELEMRFFMPLYSYPGKHHFSGYIYFIEAIKRIINIYRLNKISFYNCKFNNYFNVSSDMNYLLSFFFADLEKEFLAPSHYTEFNCTKLLNRINGIVKKINRRPLWAIKKALCKLANNIKFQKFSNHRKTLLLFGDLYELDFLKEHLHEYNVLYYGFNSKTPAGFKFDNLNNSINVDFRNFDFINDREDPFKQIFLQDIKEDFTKNIAKYIEGINVLRKIDKKYPISLALWGSAPIKGLKSLIFEYARSRGVKILGAQHGGLYGDSFAPWHIDSDFNRCDFFISYGFTKEDLNRLYPKEIINCEIIPYGKTKLINKNKAKKKIDILFPLTMSFSMFAGGMIRVTPDKLLERQVIILEYLNSLKDLKIYIKPLPYSTAQHCCVLPILERLKNLRVVDSLNLLEFLEVYEPRIALIEFPSQPLFECLCSDAEIFLINNEVHPFEKKALEELKKRVHYSEAMDEFISKLDLFLNNELRKKKDNAFCNHYIDKGNTRHNILQLINSLVYGNLNSSNLKNNFSPQLLEGKYV